MPSEILTLILLQLKASQLCQLHPTCKKFLQILSLSNDSFWSAWFSLHFPEERVEYVDLGLKFLSLPWKWVAKSTQKCVNSTIDLRFSGLGYWKDDKRIYFGQFELGSPHGKGIRYNIIGSIYAGQWNSGLSEGYFLFFFFKKKPNFFSKSKLKKKKKKQSKEEAY